MIKFSFLDCWKEVAFMSSSDPTPIHTGLPLLEPHRSGTYLIYDYEPGTDMHWREGTDLLRASGSHQLDVQPLTEKLASVVAKVKSGGELHLVDLRQESHVFFDGCAVSWHADKDWANVGQSLEWIQNDETGQIAKLWAWPGANTVQIFCLDAANKKNGHAVPTGYFQLTVGSATAEAELASKMVSSCPVRYVRIPVTDHCMPTLDAVKSFIDFCRRLYHQPEDQKWVHFHCHAGDGRTTTFLAMYHMVCWAKSGRTPFPTLQQFAQWQRDLFHYQLDPGDCSEKTDWKCGLARARWQFLGGWRDWVASGGLIREEPFDLKKIGATP